MFRVVILSRQSNWHIFLFKIVDPFSLFGTYLFNGLKNILQLSFFFLLLCLIFSAGRNNYTMILITKQQWNWAVIISFFSLYCVCSDFRRGNKTLIITFNLKQRSDNASKYRATIHVEYVWFPLLKCATQYDVWWRYAVVGGIVK